MARRKRVNIPGYPYHIVQRGNNKVRCFADLEDFAFFSHLLITYKKKFNVDVHAWVFMSNHFHILATQQEPSGISNMIQSVGRRYVPYFNFRHKRTGTLWEGRFHSSIVDSDEYLLTVYRYIELNPVRAHMVNTPNEYHWSSFATNGYGRPSSLLTPHPVYTALGETEQRRREVYRSMFMEDIEGERLNQVRRAINSNTAYGSHRFKKTVELASGISQGIKSEAAESSGETLPISPVTNAKDED